jgi:molybdopterin-guanine dinucleotide biosynthesis protein MobB
MTRTSSKDEKTMMRPVVLGFYGYSGSGKTTLVEKLIHQLAQKNYRVAAIKSTPHQYSLDTLGSDTWKFSQAGAQLVVFQTGKESSFIFNKNRNVQEIIEDISLLKDFDVILIEGSLDGCYPRIRVDTTKPEQKNTVYTYDGDINKLLSFISNQIQNRSEPMGQSIELKVNGKRIPLTEFPRDVIKNTILGMISSLKGVDTIDEVSIVISRKKTED